MCLYVTIVLQLSQHHIDYNGTLVTKHRFNSDGHNRTMVTNHLQSMHNNPELLRKESEIASKQQVQSTNGIIDARISGGGLDRPYLLIFPSKRLTS